MKDLSTSEPNCKAVYEYITGGEHQRTIVRDKHVTLIGFEDSGNSELDVYYDGEIFYKRRGAFQLLPLTPFQIVNFFNQLGLWPVCEKVLM